MPSKMPLGLLILWEVAVRSGLIEDRLMPPPSRIATIFVALARSGELLTRVAATLWRVGIGFAISALAGITLGALSG